MSASPPLLSMRGIYKAFPGVLALDTNRMGVAVRGVPVQVTALEYRLLSYLMLHRDRVVPPTELLEHLYGDDDAREANALEAVIARLRRKLGPGIIATRVKSTAPSRARTDLTV